MVSYGPFHSLTDTDQQALATRLHTGMSVRRAAGELDLNYSHALNYAHSLGYGHRKPLNQHALDKAVDLVAQGYSLTDAADLSQTNLTAVFHAATAAGVHHPRKVPRGDGATTRRVEYLQLRLSALGRLDAARACDINPRTALNYDKGLTKVPHGKSRQFVCV